MAFFSGRGKISGKAFDETETLGEAADIATIVQSQVFMRGLNAKAFKSRLSRHFIEMETAPLKLEMRYGWLYEVPDGNGIPTRLVTKIDGNAFNEFWCEILCS